MPISIILARERLFSTAMASISAISPGGRPKVMVCGLPRSFGPVDLASGASAANASALLRFDGCVIAIRNLRYIEHIASQLLYFLARLGVACGRHRTERTWGHCQLGNWSARHARSTPPTGSHCPAW